MAEVGELDLGLPATGQPRQCEQNRALRCGVGRDRVAAGPGRCTADDALRLAGRPAPGEHRRDGGHPRERVGHVPGRLAGVDGDGRCHLGHAGVRRVHGCERGDAGRGGRRCHAGAGDAVAAAPEGGAGDQQLGAGLLCQGEDLGGGVARRRRVVVAAVHGGDQLVALGREGGGQLAPRPDSALARRRRRGRLVLAADARKELVDVVDDSHALTMSAPDAVSFPHPRGLSAAMTTAVGTSIAAEASTSRRAKRSPP